ncbi:hypothetical protein DFH11DRAFT_928791 [Phellopilus nigrolimitatus]|nr:hypothetical protein DFH11DRAFT_928791 [Phellopilus nigrolimitatus]
METFTEEWLVKVDNVNSVPYLLKFGISDDKSTVCVLITDTKTVWAEVLTTKQLVRRWQDCNSALSAANSDEAIPQLPKLLSLVHTPGAMSDANFDIVDSRDADLAFELDCDEFKWRWDTYLLGPKTAADVISKHLIMPLISIAHVSFYSADPVSELSEEDLEKTVDRIGRSARRSIDIHVKHTLARPRIATTLQRISSLFAFGPLLPPIKSEFEAPDFKEQLAALRAQSGPTTTSPPHADYSAFQSDISHDTNHAEEPSQSRTPAGKTPGEMISSAPTPANIDSETESDDDDVQAIPASTAQAVSEGIRKGNNSPAVSAGPSVPTSRVPEAAAPCPTAVSRRSDSDSSPPLKKLKAQTSRNDDDTDTDSDTGSKGRSQASQGSRGAPRGVRQPLKRRMKRF